MIPHAALRRIATVVAAIMTFMGAGMVASVPAGASSVLAGGGSSFAGIEMDQWTDDVSNPPYSLQISYNPTSSGDGRTFFRDGTDAYGVSDIPYQGGAADDPTPTFSFEYIPVVAGGLGFMYNLPGNPALKLDANTACGIFTGEITNWDDSALAALNPGVTLPNLTITPVLRGDLAGTNWVLEDWCMTEAPAVWDSFVNYVNAHIGDYSNSDTPPVGLTTPSSAFPISGSEETANGDSGTASIVGSSSSTGFITYVEPEYAKEYGNKPVASVENFSGDFAQPTPENVAGALAYANGQSNGIQVLNFGGSGCNVYNPSTYSYILARTDGSYGQSYGQTLGGFLNYVLTIGEKQASAIDYASIGLSLEQYGIQAAQNIPGYPALSATESANFAAGDVTPAIVQATACGAAFQLAVPATTTTVATTTTTVAPTTTTVAPTTTTVAPTTTTVAPTTTTGATTTTTAGQTTATTAPATTATTTAGQTTAATTHATTATTAPTTATTARTATAPPTTAVPTSGGNSGRTTPTTAARTTPGLVTPTTGNRTTPGLATPTTALGSRTIGATTPTSAAASSGPSTASPTTQPATLGSHSSAPTAVSVAGAPPAGSATTLAGPTAAPGTATEATVPGSSGAAVPPTVSLTNTGPDAQTGGQQVLLVLAGLGIAGTSEFARRRLRRAR